MLTLLRRFLVIAAFAFWQGGFTFYAAVVVPIGTEILGSPRDQGFITRHVTKYINLSGGVALVLFSWDNLAGRDPATWRRRLRWLAWFAVLACLAVLVWLHPSLNERMVGGDAGPYRILDRAGFRHAHRWYLWISTVQWGAGLVYLVTTLGSWSARSPEPAGDVRA